MTATPETEQQILDAAVRLMAVNPWPRIALADIAKEAGVSIAELYRLYASRHAVLCALYRRLDLEMLAAPVDEGSARDRLFDLLMRRFDALAPFKPAFATGLSELKKGRLGALEPALMGGLNLHRSMLWVLEAAGLAESCFVNELRAKILGAVYLATFRVWLDDDATDLPRTMAALDKSLKRAAPFMKFRDPAAEASTADPNATEATAK